MTDDDKHYDTTTPFLAICGDRTEDGEGYYDKTYSVYLINPTDLDLENVVTSTGGHYTAGDDLLIAEGGPPKQWGTLPARSLVCIEATSDDEIDELVIWWNVAFEVTQERQTLHFGAFKGLADSRSCPDIPILGRGGVLVRRELQRSASEDEGIGRYVPDPHRFCGTA